MALVLDADRFRLELGRRGLSQEEFCRLAGIAEPTLSRALNGRPVQPTTLRKLDVALRRAPMVADGLIAAEAVP